MFLWINIPYLYGVCVLSSDFDAGTTDLIIFSHTLRQLLTNESQQQLLPNSLLSKLANKYELLNSLIVKHLTLASLGILNAQ